MKTDLFTKDDFQILPPHTAEIVAKRLNRNIRDTTHITKNEGSWEIQPITEDMLKADREYFESRQAR